MKNNLLTKLLVLTLIGSLFIIPAACGGSDDSNPIVVVEDPKPDPTHANTTIVATSPVVADGTATSTITVTLADTKGQRFNASGGTVALTTTGSANISAVTDNSNGTYAATVTNMTAETVTISGTLGGTAITDTAQIIFDPVAGPGPDPTGTTIEVTSPVAADGMAASTVTVTVLDTEGNPFTTSGGTVALVSTGAAIISVVTDNNDGTYSATVTNTTAETVTISGTLSGIDITDTADIIFETLPDPTGTTIEATSPVPADGMATSTITVTLIDTEGNPFTTSGGTVVLVSTGAASISEVTDNNDGTYSATASNTAVGNVTISGTLGGTAIVDTAEIIFEPVLDPDGNAGESTDPVGPTLLKINCGGGELTIGADTFLADQYFEGASVIFLNETLTEVANTDLDALFYSERITNNANPTAPFFYKIPVTNGTYTVKLYWAEVYWGVHPDGIPGGVGSRIFSVTMEGLPIVSNIDLFDELGAATADTRMYDIEVTDGELTIMLQSTVDRPKISGIEIFGSGTVNP